MGNPNDDLPVFPSYDAPGGHGVLLDHAQQVKHRDFADADVRSAVRSVAAAETKRNLASELGLEGVSRLQEWDRRIEEVGPSAAIEAARLYASQPRIPAQSQQEEERNEDDHSRSAREAFRQVQEREERQAHMPSALQGLDRLEQRHGSLTVVSDFRRWNDQLMADPQDAAARVATEIQNRIADAQGMQQAAQQVNDYQSQHRISDDERAVMQRALASGEVHDLPTAHAWARYATAVDIKDGHERDVVAAARTQEGSEVFFAKLTVADFERTHPDIRREGPLRSRMRQLLTTGAARDMETAYAMARR
jgi:hypothetical protein